MNQHHGVNRGRFTRKVVDIKLPPIPNTLSEILQIRAEKQPDIDRLIRVVQNDPVITANVLRRVNSAFYSIRRHVSHIDKALMFLGFKEVCGIVLTAAVKQAFVFKGSADTKIVYVHIMKTSIATASFARHLCKYLGLSVSETAFTAGLLHQLGRLVLLNSAPKGYAQIWMHTSELNKEQIITPPTSEMEDLIFKTNYIRVGTAVAQQWSLPEDLSTVIEYHNKPDKVQKTPLRTLTSTVTVGMEAASLLFEKKRDVVYEATPTLIELADIRNKEYQGIVDYLNDRREEVEKFAESLLQD